MTEDKEKIKEGIKKLEEVGLGFTAGILAALYGDDETCEKYRLEDENSRVFFTEEEKKVLGPVKIENFKYHDYDPRQKVIVLKKLRDCVYKLKDIPEIEFRGRGPGCWCCQPQLVVRYNKEDSCGQTLGCDSVSYYVKEHPETDNRTEKEMHEIVLDCYLRETELYKRAAQNPDNNPSIRKMAEKISGRLEEIVGDIKNDIKNVNLKIEKNRWTSRFFGAWRMY